VISKFSIPFKLTWLIKWNIRCIESDKRFWHILKRCLINIHWHCHFTASVVKVDEWLISKFCDFFLQYRKSKGVAWLACQSGISRNIIWQYCDRYFWLEIPENSVFVLNHYNYITSCGINFSLMKFLKNFVKSLRFILFFKKNSLENR